MKQAVRKTGSSGAGRAVETGWILLTGGTGFLGSHLAAALLRRGSRLILLARSGKQGSARQRVSDLMDWHGVGKNLRRRLVVIEGDLEKPGFGLDGKTRGDIKGRVQECVHCASQTSFAERKRAEVEAVNLGGLGHALDFAAEAGVRAFHHISTVYVAGKAGGVCREELAQGRSFHNVYEETKCLGEWRVWERCRAAGIRPVIHRPSIVYGNSRTGRSLRFDALYYPVRAALFLKDLYLSDIRQRDGRRAAAAGVRVEPDGAVHLPIRIEVDGGGINLVPVDYFVRAFLAIRQGARAGGIFHIVNRRPTKVVDIINFSKRLFGLTGIEAVPPGDMGGRPRSALETLFANSLEAYAPYMRDRRTFDTAKSAPLLASRGVVCPEFDFGVFSRCMTFALETEWGSRIFSDRGCPSGSQPRPAEEYGQAAPLDEPLPRPDAEPGGNG